MSTVIQVNKVTKRLRWIGNQACLLEIIQECSVVNRMEMTEGTSLWWWQWIWRDADRDVKRQGSDLKAVNCLVRVTPKWPFLGRGVCRIGLGLQLYVDDLYKKLIYV